MASLTHDDIMKINIVKLANGVIAGHDDGEPLQIVALPGGIDSRYERLLISSAFLYRTVHANMTAFEILLKLCEDAGAETLVMQALDMITADRQALSVAVDGFEAVADDIKRGKAIR